jgi:ketosteroid isomerase-like protein
MTDPNLPSPADEQVALLRRAYRLFNDRQVDQLLALMTEDVEWPDVAGNAVLHGKEAIRPYWEAQFAVAEPQVNPTEFRPIGDDLVAVVD